MIPRIQYHVCPFTANTWIRTPSLTRLETRTARAPQSHRIAMWQSRSPSPAQELSGDGLWRWITPKKDHIIWWILDGDIAVFIPSNIVKGCRSSAPDFFFNGKLQWPDPCLRKPQNRTDIFTCHKYGRLVISYALRWKMAIEVSWFI